MPPHANPKMRAPETAGNTCERRSDTAPQRVHKARARSRHRLLFKSAFRLALQTHPLRLVNAVLLLQLGSATIRDPKSDARSEYAEQAITPHHVVERQMQIPHLHVVAAGQEQTDHEHQ